MDKLMVVDGHNLLFRMFYGFPNKVYNHLEQPIHGIIGFVGSIIKLVQSNDIKNMVIVFDSEIPSDKFNDFNYKKNRIQDYSAYPEDENPFSQLPGIKKCLDYMGIEYIEIEKVEADDAIATIVSNYRMKFKQVLIVSTDKDYLQLIDDNVRVLSPRGKLSILYDEEKVREILGIEASKYVIYRSLVGDKSDNIEGLKGIGRITASKLLRSYSSVNEIYANVDNLNNKIANILLENRKTLLHNIELITLNSSVKLPELTFQIDDKFDYKTMEVLRNCSICL